VRCTGRLFHAEKKTPHALLSASALSTSLFTTSDPHPKTQPDIPHIFVRQPGNLRISLLPAVGAVLVFPPQTLQWPTALLTVIPNLEYWWSFVEISLQATLLSLAVPTLLTAEGLHLAGKGREMVMLPGVRRGAEAQVVKATTEGESHPIIPDGHGIDIANT
jgi:hypothetical protein